MPLDPCKDPRYAQLSSEQIEKLFKEESDLREYLLTSPKERRAQAFCWAYDELFRRCPWHPALTEKSGISAPEVVARRVSNMRRWLPPVQGTRVLEIGCGMGEMMIGLSKAGYHCVGIDVSEIRIQNLQTLESSHLEFRNVEGTALPFPNGSFDIVISMQLFEHLHPDDAQDHLCEVHRVLKPGGIYLLETPNRLTGPGDVSRFYADEPLGFHLKEYSIRQLKKMFYRGGFCRVQVLLRWNKLLPGFAVGMLELAWSSLPKPMRRRHSYGMHNPVYFAHSQQA